MKIGYRIVIAVLAILAGVLFFWWLIQGNTVTLFMPAGVIAAQQGTLIITEVLLMLLVAVPMLALLFYTAWKYRSGGTKGTYSPDWHGGKSQLILWAIPLTLIAVLSVLNWRSAHLLDPFRPIPSENATLEVNVVALPWKWLFIYPAQNIATVNFLEFPVNTPVHFNLTADAPMSSFWIPQLGSQMYAMDAMVTQLNLIASTTGDFAGKDTEINGPGYAGMTFTARSASEEDFNAWVSQVKQSPNSLTLSSYNELAKPSEYVPPAYYASVDSGLYNTIVMKFMVPSSSLSATGTQNDVLQQIPAMHDMQGMHM